jgi:hypothetical protein
MCRLAEERTMALCHAARVETKEFRESAVAEAKEILVKATETEEIQAQVTAEVEEILAAARRGRPLIVGRHIPFHASDEA